MPTKKIRDSERRRCAQACESCKHRKQRCDGLRPCRRCVRRGVGRECQQQGSSSSPAEAGVGGTVLRVTRSNATPGRTAVRRRGGGGDGAGLVASSLPSPDPEYGGGPTPITSVGQVDVDSVAGEHQQIQHISESSRRAQTNLGGGDTPGHQPPYTDTTPFSLLPDGLPLPLPLPLPLQLAPQTITDTPNVDPILPPASSSSINVLSEAPPARVPQMSRLVKDTKGQYMFIGDSATLSFLQNIRRIVRRCIDDDSDMEPCSFVNDQLRHFIVEATPERRSRGWILSSAENPPPKPTAPEAAYLKQWYRQSANCVLLLFDESELDRDMDEWLRLEDGDKTNFVSSVYYLVFAIGAQTGPEDKDDLAEVFFNYGRYLTVETLMEDPDIPTIQAFSLITMYLLGASRRNSAFMYLGMAVRAAYALGLHRKDISAMFPPAECQVRERAWKAIRILDLFMSASLGRPPSTAETRDTASGEDYSACNDLSKIFESVLCDVYAKRVISTDVLEQISKDHRRWAIQSSGGLERDGIQQQDGGTGAMLRNGQPNMGLLHLKQTAYWTIILLSLPFLLKAVSQHVDSHMGGPRFDQEKGTSPPSNQALVFACLESAIGSIDLLEPVLSTNHVPKRLPFVINSVFVSGLVLGAATFGDLDANFPLDRSLRLARSALKRFSRHDAVAKRHSVILDHLQEACDNYMEVRARRKMERQGHLVKGLFGCIDTIGSTPQDTHEQRELADPALARSAYNQNYADPSSASININDPANLALGTGHQTLDSLQHGHLPTDGEMPDFVPAISPSMLWFDSLGNTLPLFPIVDAHLIEEGMEDLSSYGHAFLV